MPVSCNIVSIASGAKWLQGWAEDYVKMRCCVCGFVAPLIMLHVQGTCCAGRWWHGQDQAGHGAVAGALAGLSMYFYSAPSLALYTIWKVVEVSY